MPAKVICFETFELYLFLIMVLSKKKGNKKPLTDIFAYVTDTDTFISAKYKL